MKSGVGDGVVWLKFVCQGVTNAIFMLVTIELVHFVE